MNKLFTKITSLALGAAMMIGVGVAVGSKSVGKADAESVYKTALFGSSYNSDSVSSYTASWSSTTNGFTVDLENWNNNQNGWDYIKAGTGSTITTHSAIDQAITKVSINISAISTVSSITLYTGTSASSITTNQGTFTKATGDQSVTISSPTANLFYKIAVVTSSTKQLSISNVKFYIDGEGPGPEPTPETEHEGTVADPYSASDAVLLTSSLGNNEYIDETVYLKGVISDFDEIDSNGKGYFSVSDGTNSFYVNGISGFSSTKGDSNYVELYYTVTVYGYLQNWNNEVCISYWEYASEASFVSATTPNVESLTATVSGTHLLGTKLVESDFSVEADFVDGPQDIAITDNFIWTVNDDLDGNLVEGNNEVVVFYENGETDPIIVVGGTNHITDLSFSVDRFNVAVGGNVKLLPTITKEDSTKDATDTITWTTGSSSVATVSNDGTVTAVGAAGTNTTVTASANNHSASYTLYIKNVTTSSDEITPTLINSSSYGNWSGKVPTNENHSDAIYAGNSQGGTSKIQIRAESNSGIVSTASGGTLKKITVVWDSSTSNGRKLDIYGKTTAYTASSDLYDANKRGTLLGSLVYGTSSELTITGDYTYIGLRSNANAHYLSKVTIQWESIVETKTIGSISVTSGPTKDTYARGEELSLTGLVVTADYEEPDVEDGPISGYKVYQGSTLVDDSSNKYKFTEADATAGSVVFTVKADDDTSKTDTFSVSVGAAKPTRLLWTTSPSWTDTQTLGGGSAVWKVEYTDSACDVTDIHFGDPKTSLFIDEKEVDDLTQLAKNFAGKQGVFKYTDQGVTVEKQFNVIVNVELSVDSFSGVPGYVLAGNTTDTITVQYTSLNGALDAQDGYSVISSQPELLTVNTVTNTYDSNTKKGTLTFTVSGVSSKQGQANIIVSISKNGRTESNSASLLVRSSAPQPGSTDYVKISSLDQLTDGEYVIAAYSGTKYYAMSNDFGTKIDGTEIAVSNDKITTADVSSYVVNIEKTVSDNKSYIFITDGTYYVHTKSSKTDLLIDTTKGTTGEEVRFVDSLFKVGNYSASRFIMYSSSAGKYGNYSGSNWNDGTYCGLTLFKKTSSSAVKTGLDYVNDFVNDNIKMNTISIDDKGSGACKGENGYYLTAKRAWNTMITTYNSEVAEADRENLVEVFEDNFADAYERYMSWATACGDTAPFTGTEIVPAQNNSLVKALNISENPTIVIIIISVIGVSALGGFFFLRKRKEI